MTSASLVVGVGASAGGLEALEQFFRGLPRELNAAFIVVQHLSPDHKSLMAELLAKHTAMPVREAVDGMLIEPGTVAMVPPRSNLEVEGDCLRLRERSGTAPNLPINQFFVSLAQRYAERSVGVVLSGTGSDGRHGVETIKQAGGLVLVQSPTTARFDGMPLAAIATRVADAVLDPAAMGDALLRTASTIAVNGVITASLDEHALEAILAALLRTTGIDFSEYKQATVLRRITRRMTQVGVTSMGAFLERLLADPAESRRLAHELLINVTQFFRDPEVFTALEQTVLPQLVARVGREPMRAWVAGCSTGQEAYTLAMLLAELDPPGSFKIFATDVDSEALGVAAAGLFSQAEAADVPPRLAQRYLRETSAGFEIDRELRRRVVFAPHNVARDAPFSRLDFISCRNLLIYLSLALQRRVLGTFASALRGEGVLLLGSSESLGDSADRFRVADGALKIFHRNPTVRSLALEPRARVTPALPLRPRDHEHTAAFESALRLLVDKVAPAAVLVSPTLEVLRVFGNVDSLLTLPTGTATLSLLPMLPEALRTATGIATHRALDQNVETILAVDAAGVRSVHAQPMTVAEARFLVVSFERAAPNVAGPVGTFVPNDAHQHVDDLERELAFVRENLQSTIEELETSNEELQATNEELLSSNEELQSTNEELQSVNEELHTVNAEHQERISELTRVNADLDNLFDASPHGILVTDEALRIRRFTPALTRDFSVLSRDVGRPLEHITHRFKNFDPVTELRRVQEDAQVVERELESTDGRISLVRLSPYLTATREVRGAVATFVDVTALRRAEEEQRSLQRLIDSLPQMVAVLDSKGRIRFANRAWFESAFENGATPASQALLGAGADYLAACRSVPATQAGLEGLLAGQQESFAVEYACHSPTQQRWFLLEARRMGGDGGLVISHTNVTARKLLELKQ